MEKGADNSSGFCVSDKKSSFPSDDVCLLKLLGTQPSFPSKICMMGFHEKNNPRRFGESVSDDGGGGRNTCGGGWGPTGGGGVNEIVANMYLHGVSTSGDCAERMTSTSTSTLLPFEVFPYCSTTGSKSTGGMAASVGFPFTFAQWKELERQAMIYKYMIASVPVPADLLFPLSRNFPDTSVTLAGGSDSIYMARYSKKGDPEPGRCKRTDGKKWRCSRDVAPQQKYCERHLHRGRPRSRKPVEAKSNAENQKKARLEQSPLPASSDTSQQFAAAGYQPHSLYNPRSDLKASTPFSKGDDRDMGLMMGSGIDTLKGSQLQLQHLTEAHIGVTYESSPVYNFHQDYPEQQLLNLLPYSNFSTTEIESPSTIIDAWPTDNLNCDQRNRSPSFNLPVDLAADNVMDQEKRKIVAGSGDLKDFDGYKANDDSGNSIPVSWEPFARGGPLAEALQLGSVAIGESNPASPYRSISTPATTISSPSGVNHRTMFSNSDSSVSNSPTLAAAPHSEVAFQWHN